MKVASSQAAQAPKAPITMGERTPDGILGTFIPTSTNRHGAYRNRDENNLSHSTTNQARSGGTILIATGKVSLY